MSLSALLQPTSSIRPAQRYDIFVFLTVAPLDSEHIPLQLRLIGPDAMQCISSCHAASERPVGKTGRAVYGGHHEGKKGHRDTQGGKLGACKKRDYAVGPVFAVLLKEASSVDFNRARGLRMPPNYKPRISDLPGIATAPSLGTMPGQPSTWVTMRWRRE